MIVKLSVAAAAASLSWGAPAAARDAEFGYCLSSSSSKAVISPLFDFNEGPDSGNQIERNWEHFVKREFGIEGSSFADCHTTADQHTSGNARTRHLNNIVKAGKKALVKVDYVPLKWYKASSSPPRSIANDDRSKSNAPAPQVVTENRDQPQQAPVKTRADYEAEYQARLAAHEAKTAEYQRKVKAREAEIARQQSEHAAAQEKARQVQAAHAKRLAEAQRAREEWLAVKRRHDRCMGGDQQACADMAAGKPASADKLADAGEASTDTDANRCVTTAETRTDASFKGNTSASVLNGCGQKVDVRICLKRTAGWNCATVWGVDPQARATHSSFDATGEVFVDAKVSDSARPLAHPAGY